jgi:hypothetical protein
LSFHLQGFWPSRDLSLFPGSILPCCFASALEQKPAASKVCPLRKADAQQRQSQSRAHALLAFSPLRLSLSLPWSQLPSSSSLVLSLRRRRSTHKAGTPESCLAASSAARVRTSLTRYRPLWDLPPRRPHQPTGSNSSEKPPQPIARRAYPSDASRATSASRFTSDLSLPLHE